MDMPYGTSDHHEGSITRTTRLQAGAIRGRESLTRHTILLRRNDITTMESYSVPSASSLTPEKRHQHEYDMASSMLVTIAPSQGGECLRATKSVSVTTQFSPIQLVASGTTNLGVTSGFRCHRYWYSIAAARWKDSSFYCTSFSSLVNP
eukprot:gb/GECG01002421.1/.p1 GENE.gb/GECG01002421.1/~~gb/GECG01002421.1/.p1  ORF type:complete len:149 (+),score=8.59 gb/GECG01002421.1/:1-447(+)